MLSKFHMKDLDTVQFQMRNQIHSPMDGRVPPYPSSLYTQLY